MKELKFAVGILLSAASVWLALNGLVIVFQTMGSVSGSEFGMLITLANVVSCIALWLGLFGLWTIIPSSQPTNDEAPTHVE